MPERAVDVRAGELNASAVQVLRPHRVGDRLFGDVAAPLHEWPEPGEP